MPHISIKMLKGRTEEQKKLVCENLTKTLCETLGCSKEHVSVEITDYTAKEWQDVFAKEIEGSKNLYKKPEYDPKDLL
ncbi:MAG TPA: tautomerase family protein [Oscillospiraceae bacterium]|jgi:4-oxalocrotonate tautomerase|nr:tautomerase enzyme family protein [Oscillospiraceae bacterium]HOV40736.1 tautomerase family protein [Oscillospiraceae bacterium]